MHRVRLDIKRGARFRQRKNRNRSQIYVRELDLHFRRREQVTRCPSNYYKKEQALSSSAQTQNFCLLRGAETGGAALFPAGTLKHSYITSFKNREVPKIFVLHTLQYWSISVFECRLQNLFMCGSFKASGGCVCMKMWTDCLKWFRTGQ